MEIVTMTDEHVLPVASLEAACISEPWTEGQIRDALVCPWAIWLVALEEGALAGYLGVEYGPDGGTVVSVTTDPAFRRRGAARALFAAMEQRLLARGLRWLTLEVRPSNVPARSLYTSLGFQEVGRRPRFYRKPTEDAILMTRSFGEESEC